jgi:hypothetical protein
MLVFLSACVPPNLVFLTVRMVSLSRIRLKVGTNEKHVGREVTNGLALVSDRDG